MDEVWTSGICHQLSSKARSAGQELPSLACISVAPELPQGGKNLEIFTRYIEVIQLTAGNR